MIPLNESPQNKRFSIHGSRRRQHLMMVLKPPKSDYRDNYKLRMQHMLLKLRHLRGTVIK
jgi:hypothetical protein